MKLSAQARVGIVTVLAVILLATVIVWKGDIFLRASGYTLTGRFENVSGLTEGADVRYRGFKVGKSVSVEPRKDENLVTMFVDSQVTVPKDSRLRIAFDGLIGQKYLELIPGSSEAVLKPGDTINGFSTLGLVDFIDVGTKNLQESKRILTSFREISEDPDVKKAVRGTLLNVGNATSDIRRMSQRISVLADQLQKVTANLDSVFGQEEARELKESIHSFSKISRALGALGDDPSFAKDLRGLIANSKEAAAEIRDAARRASKALERFGR